ncbi:BTB/POZ domain-containing protein [Raphanus sativus]|uniref:BTB/POZ domain-containing protein At3g19850 n=1 Tax=Raphanus sativus TaxID=3726 RepID=A0A9W3C2F3_RAPSA|nr:BTB/POZ domain-containing protein At3g19850 [Raphanus sativus]KAJ4886954.1 BTB/POZ domain-containing protein [Raphanus sativus]
MSLLCDLQINIDQEFTFFVNQDLMSEYSGFLRKLIKQSNKKKKNHKNGRTIIQVQNFPGGPDGFDLVSRFCYSNGGGISIDVSNVSILYCSSLFLEMTEILCSSNLSLQTEKFLEGMFYWSWNDIVSCLKSCERVFLHADSYGLVDKLVFGVLAKIAQNSDMSQVFASSSTSSSASASSMSPETAKNRSDSDKRSTSRSFSCKTSNEWWFDDMSSLGPKVIERLIKNLGAFDQDNDSLVLTRFLLHYLKTKVHSKSNSKLEYSGLANTAVQGVIFAAKTSFSCRKILWVLRVLSGFSISKESRTGLERVIGEMLDQATLDDLLIPTGGKRDKGFYDVDLVVRLLKVFVRNCSSTKEEDESLRIRRMGKLIDEYLREISPDQNLKVSKFLEVAESLPDSARDWFDGLFRAIDIYLESHPNLLSEDRTKLCRCLNYKKLTLETCKQLAKNPKIPPNIAVQALKSQQLSNETLPHSREDKIKLNKTRNSRKYVEEKPILVRLKGFEMSDKLVDGFEDDIKMNLEKRHWNKVMDNSQKVCKEKKSEVVSRLVRHGHTHSSSNFPRLC